MTLRRGTDAATNVPRGPRPTLDVRAPRVRRALRWLVPLLVAHTGVLMALASPHQHLAYAWAGMFVPLFLALDLALRATEDSRRRVRWLTVLACTWPAGVVMAAISGDWVTNTAYVYGGLPHGLAFAVNALGYGSLQGLELFAYVGVPFALAWRRPVVLLGLVPLWCTVFQVYLPRFLDFTYGQAMVTSLPLVQFADVLGSGGLNLLYLPLQLVLYGWLRRLYAPGELRVRALGVASLALLVAFGAAYGYGRWRMEAVPAAAADAPHVQLVGIQPDFTLARLASNPALSHSQREQSLEALLADSDAALADLEREPGVPVVVLWPESVYPRAFFLAPAMRERVEAWVRRNDVELVLASLDVRLRREAGQAAERDVYGVAVHVGADGRPREVYRKIALIPFGETIPFGDWFPWYARALQALIPRISQFTPGKAFTAFTLGNGVRLAPMICFDTTVSHVAVGMARNGAQVGVVLANLAWFGPTTVSDQFAWFIRFRAIETRMPVLFLSQNGESYLVDALGRPQGPRLGQFESGHLAAQVAARPRPNGYLTYGVWVERAYLLALLALVGYAFGWPAVRGRVR